MKTKMTIRDLCFIGIFTAMIAVIGQISIPMPYGVPMTLQTFIISLAGVVLGAKRGTLATLLYIALGAVGVPLFAGFAGGIGVLFGPTSGFILSFPIIALCAGVGAGKNNSFYLFLWLLVGTAINFLCGMLMFSLITTSSLYAAFIAAVLPFIPVTVVKIVLAGILGVKIRNTLAKGALLS